MTLVKIKIDRKSSGYLQKYLVELIPQIHHTVKDFLKMTKLVLDIDWPLTEIIILKSGYTLPHSLSSRIFAKSQNSSFKIIHSTDQIALNSNANISVNAKSKKKYTNSPSLSQSQQIQQSSSQIQSVKLKVPKKKAAQKIKPQSKSRKMSIQEQQQQQSQQSVQQSVQQSSEQSSDLPVICNKKTQLKDKKQLKSKIVSDVKSNSSNSQQSQSDSTQKHKNNNKTKNMKNQKKDNMPKTKDFKVSLNHNQIAKKQKKKIIQMDSSSQESSQELKIKKNQHNKSETNINKIAQRNISSVKIPPSVRQKYQKNTFKTHQQQQWIPVSKQMLKKHYQQEQNKTVPFVKINNVIRFKIIQLDQQRFVPVSSQWIEGTVSSINSQGKIILSKVTQINRPFRETYEIFQHNMLELLINKNFILKEQTLFLNQEKPQQNVIKTNQQKNQQNQDKSQQKQEQKCSLEKFICGQVNFYFSDKNYPTDLFMRMHANNHPEKYFPIRVMLNFPKIKKMLKDQNKLFEYLVTDEKKNERNFQIDEVNKMIRKKVTEKHKENIDESALEEKQHGQIKEN